MYRRTPIEVGEYYHIYSRGVDKRQIFMDKSDYERFVCLLLIAQQVRSISISDLYRAFYAGRSCEGPSCVKDWILGTEEEGGRIISVGAWCLMPNHFHLLVKETTVNGVSLFIRRLLTSYSMYFNKKYDRTGTLFSGRFKAEHLNSDEYLKHIYSYIHLNPVAIIDPGWKEKKIKDPNKAQLFINNYEYSSLKDYRNVNRRESKILNKMDFPNYFESLCDMDDLLEEWLASFKL